MATLPTQEELLQQIRANLALINSQPPKEPEPVEIIPVDEHTILEERTATDHRNRDLLAAFKLQIDCGKFQLPSNPDESGGDSFDD